jgi:hypothetical protein
MIEHFSILYSERLHIEQNAVHFVLNRTFFQVQCVLVLKGAKFFETEKLIEIS